eukprot:PLAT6794.3.p2 GENE.PLAT6794.3~~PLAT6794.3.p2  ORF type:complete len:479 (-),score=217.08 PLAT6794.3:145-1524(-)
MARIVRSSKFRHVYAEPFKADLHYTDLRLATATSLGNYIAANGKYFAIPYRGGGGPVAVIPHSRVGKQAIDLPVVNGHSSTVLDLAWNPFNEDILATASDDCTVKLWGIPDGGLTDSSLEPLCGLMGHQRKVNLVKWHPVAADVLMTTSSDFTVKVWDVTTSEAVVSLEQNEQLVNDIAWDRIGDQVASSCKDKTVRVFDTRAGTVAHEFAEAHEGGKAIKVVWVGDNLLCTVGFTRRSQRQFKLWDLTAGASLCTIEVDQSAGVMMPFFDEDTNMLYLAGKGDGNIRYYELDPKSAPFAYQLDQYRTAKSARGMCVIPKRHGNILRCEVARMLKLTRDTVEPLSFIVPRKSDMFQPDIFPDTYAGIPGMDSTAWFGGENKEPMKVSLAPDGGGATSGGGSKRASMAAKSPAVLQKELDEAQNIISKQAARIAALESALAAAGVDVPAESDGLDVVAEE